MKRLLIIDDDCFKEEESIRAGFANTGVEYFLCDNKDDGVKLIKSKALFDCIVLDWFLEEENSTLSQLVLKELQGNYYAPVLIYSAHAENFLQVKESGVITFPDNLIHVVTKGNFSAIRMQVQNWLATNTTANLSSIYLEKIYESAHKTFWQLNDIPHGNIAAVYKHIISENGSIDWENDFIINLLLQHMTSDEDFRTKISAMVEQLNAENPQTSPAEKQKILNTILYSKSNSPFIANGDVVKLQVGDDVTYGIISSPDCDLANNKSKYIEFIELRPFAEDLGNNDERGSIRLNNSDSHFFLLSLELTANVFTDLVAVFKSRNILVAQNNDHPKYPRVQNRIRYADVLHVDRAVCSVSYLCSLVNPYKAEFMQRKSSHDSRIGIPSIYKYYKTN